MEASSLPRVLIVGGGFGGLSAAKELAGKGKFWVPPDKNKKE
jgi:cation diffusion facilitator CzcD-associated flavoprotein CzcO